MTTRAYLMARIRTTTHPPTVDQVIIASDSALTVVTGHTWAQLAHTDGSTFHTAALRMEDRVRHEPWLQWAGRYLRGGLAALIVLGLLVGCEGQSGAVCPGPVQADVAELELETLDETWTLSPGADCDDGSACTTRDQVVPGGGCAGLQLVCDDGDACTRDLCDAAAGCIYVHNAGPACPP